MKGFHAEPSLNCDEKLDFTFKLLVNYLRQANGGRKVRSLLFLGTSLGNGVTTLVSEFARYLVEEDGLQVLLVDANYSAPSLHALLNKPLSPGFAEILAGTASQEVIHHIGKLPNLLFLTAGDREVFSRSAASDPARFLETINALASRVDLVLLDGAPLTLSAESSYLASKVDGVIVVAKSEKTRQQVVAAIRQRLKEAEANLIGGILNFKRYHIPEWLYQRLS